MKTIQVQLVIQIAEFMQHSATKVPLFLNVDPALTLTIFSWKKHKSKSKRGIGCTVFANMYGSRIPDTKVPLCRAVLTLSINVPTQGHMYCHQAERFLTSRVTFCVSLQTDLYSGALFVQVCLGWNLYLSTVLMLVVTAMYTIAGGKETLFVI